MKKSIFVVLAIMLTLLVTGAIYFGLKQSTNPTNTTTSNPLLGIWAVVSVEENGTTIVTDPRGATIEFLEDTFRALGGCNALELEPYHLEANSQITFSVLSTLRLCPNNVLELADLAYVDSYELNDESLTLHYSSKRTPTGSVSGSFKLKKTDTTDYKDKELLGKWAVTSVIEKGEVLLQNPKNGTIEFLEGTYQAKGGCNSFEEQAYKQTEVATRISFSVSGTKMNCPKTTLDFWNLSLVDSYGIQNDELNLYYTTEDYMTGYYILRRVAD